MNRFLMAVLLVFVVNCSYAQKGKDTIVYNLPVVNGKLVYSDSVTVKGRSKVTLDSIAKKWFDGYFIEHQQCTPPQGKDTTSSVLGLGLLEFHVSPNNIKVLKYNFLLQAKVQIDCKDGYYSYAISDIRFRQKSGFMNAILPFAGTPEYYIKLSQKKHLGIYDYSRATVRNYLSNLNSTIQACIASLNKAMAN